MLQRFVVPAVWLGFLAISALSALSHYGLAIRVTNYLFFFLVLVVIGGLITNEIKK